MAALLTFTGDSGTGKTTLMDALLKDPLFQAVRSTTTRPRRLTDKPWEYEHIHEEDFLDLLYGGALLWHTCNFGNYYGTRRSAVDGVLGAEYHGILNIIPNCVPKLLSYTAEVVPFFMVTPPVEVMRARMQERGDSQEAIARRLEDSGRWEEEARASGISYRFIENRGTIEQALEQVHRHLREYNSR